MEIRFRLATIKLWREGATACSALQTQGWLLHIAPHDELIDISFECEQSEGLKQYQILNNNLAILYREKGHFVRNHRLHSTRGR